MSLMSPPRIKQSTGPLAILAAALLWSIAGLLIKYIDWPPLAIASARSLIASLLFLFYFRRRLWIRLNGITLLSGLAIMVTQCLFVVSNKLTTATNAIMLQYTAPIFVVLAGSIFYKIRPTRREIIALIWVMIGVVLFFMERIDGGGLIGNILSVVSGLTFAGFFILNSRPECHVPAALLIGQTGTFLIGLPQLLMLRPESLNSQSVSAILILGFFQLGLGYVLFQYGIRRTRPLNASLLSIIEPLMSPVWVFLVLGEKPGILALSGAFVIITAVLYLNSVKPVPPITAPPVTEPEIIQDNLNIITPL